MRREDVIRKIVEREVRGQPLSAEAAARDARALHSAACEHFGTWETALTYAGISRRRAAIEDQYSPDRVLRKLRKLCCNGYDLSARSVARRDRRLVDTARQHFGSWRKALRAAGITLERIAPPGKSGRLDRDAIIQELHRRHRAGLTLKWSDVALENRTFALNVKYAFGSWCRGLAAAGLAPPK